MSDRALAVWDFFSDISFWPNRLQLNPRAWLGNFDPKDRDVAEALLESFVYLSRPMVEKLLTTGFVRIGGLELDDDSAAAVAARWDGFRSEVVVSYPTDWPPHPADSGHLFVRIARDVLQIPQSRIVMPDELHRLLRGRETPPPIVFVDDFAGTGDQFVRTVTRKRGRICRTSIDHEVRRRGAPAYYVPAVMTTNAHARVRGATTFQVSAGNVLPSEASARHPETRSVPPEMRSRLAAFIETYSDRAGIDPNARWGYKESALTIAFEHSVPNNTLPLFSAESSTWKPLIKR